MHAEATTTREVWLRPNRRALWLGLIVPALAIALGAWLAFGAVPRTPWRTACGAGLIVVFAWVAALLVRQLWRPRIGYSHRDGRVLFYLRAAAPVAVPVEVVEAFFVGQQRLDLPGRPTGTHAAMNLVARLSRRATDWHQRDVKPTLGQWTDGYVVIHGTWCEPLDGEVIRRLNHRLREVKQLRSSEVQP